MSKWNTFVCLALKTKTRSKNHMKGIDERTLRNKELMLCEDAKGIHENDIQFYFGEGKIKEASWKRWSPC